MKYRKLGKTGIEVSEIGFGGSAIGGHSWGEQDDQVSLRALSRAYELGINFFDTALTYGYGRSERVIGEWVRSEGVRDRVTIATKVPPMNMHWPAQPNVAIESVYPPHHIDNLVNESLRNLKIGPIDLLQFHVWQDSFTDDDAWFECIQNLKAVGKIRFFGVSLGAFDPGSALRLIEKGRVDTLQVHYNIFEQGPQDVLLPAAHDKNIGIIARAPLEESALAGKFDLETRFSEGDHRAVYFAADRLNQVVERVEKLRPVLEKAAGTW